MLGMMPLEENSATISKFAPTLFFFGFFLVYIPRQEVRAMSIASLDRPGRLQTAPERTLARLMHTVIGDHPPITCAFTFPSG